MDTMIRIEFRGEEILSSLSNEEHVATGSTIKVDNSWSASVNRLVRYRVGDFNQVLELAVSFLSGAGASLFASWLYDRLKGKSARIIIDQAEIEIDENKIKAAFIKIQKQGSKGGTS